VFYVHANRV